MAVLVIALLWTAAAYRVWLSLTRERTLWRTSFTVTAICVATAFTVHHLRAEIDAALGSPNLAGLLARITMLVGVGFLLIYHEHLRRPDVPARLMAVHLSGAGLVIGVECVSWAVAPVHGREVDDLMALASSRAVVVYCIAFWVYLGLVLAVASRTCLTGGRTFRRTDPARSASLLLIGVGELLGIPVLLLWTSSLVLRHLGQEAGSLARLGDELLPWPVLLDALGVLSLLTVPYLLALLNRWNEWRTLRPLWADLVERYPDVHLDVRPGGGPLARLQVRLERAVIETRDALRVAPVAPRWSEGRLAVESVARSLREPIVESPVCAADLLSPPETREADIRQLLALAGAYERVGHAHP